MAMLFKEITLETDGMVCARQFDLPGDGRRVLFDITPGGTFRKDIYIIVDGKFQDIAFVNGSRIQSPIVGMERLIPSPHEAFAVVVDRTEVPLEPIMLPLTKLPVMFKGGKTGTIDVQGSVKAAVFPGDSQRLAHDYVDGVVSNPSETAAYCLKTAVIQAAATMIPRALNGGDPMAGVGMIQTMGIELAKHAAQAVERQLPWCHVSQTQVELTVVNMDLVVDNANFLLNLELETKRKVLEAIVAHFGTGPLSPEVGMVIKAFIEANPGVAGKGIDDFCQCIRKICECGGTEMLMRFAQQAGVYPLRLGGAT